MEVAAAGEKMVRNLSNKAASSSFCLRSSPSLNNLRLRRIFDIFDKNGDGMITAQELSQALSCLGLEADLSELESTVVSYIKPGNGGLGFEDFVSLHRSLDNALFGCDDDECGDEGITEQEESDLTEAFKVFDVNGDGFISARELQEVLGKLGFAEGNEIQRVEQMIVSVDRNRDGRVDFFEFKNMMNILPS
ncbi:hypothetical protein LWI28_017499 [Acer negundo]|uniref:EF-hand domain-containing protein n=1 Tax=Acer negundo TaxID=4023 RepID=A0AAD5I6K9_ACENE|nr:hypothetical protein LWI28_017499 [Acer negundo]KAK4833255.1 hypothetical protein QYF36_001592 [Acer negundo]